MIVRFHELISELYGCSWPLRRAVDPTHPPLSQSLPSFGSF